MKFTCSRDDLVNNVSIVQRAVTTNSTVNILNGILIEASDDNKIKLTGYDLQTGIEADVEANVTEKGAVVIDSKFFGDIIRKLPEPEVDIISDSNFQTTIKCGQAEFKIAGLDPEPFPKLAKSVYTGGLSRLLDRWFNYYNMIIFLGFTAGMVWLVIRKKLNPAMMIIPASVFGGIIYHTICEAKSQFMLPFFIMLIPFAMYGILESTQALRKKTDFLFKENHAVDADTPNAEIDIDTV